MDTPKYSDNDFDTLFKDDILANYSPVSTIVMSFVILLILAFISACNYYAVLLSGTLGLVDAMLNNVITDGTNLEIKNCLILNNAMLFIAVFGVMFALLFGVYYKTVLMGKQDMVAAQIIAISLFSILGTVFLATSVVVPSFFNLVKIFENTIGYFITDKFNSENINSAFHVLFQNTMFENKDAHWQTSIPYNFILSTMSVLTFSSKFLVKAGVSTNFILRDQPSIKEVLEKQPKFIRDLCTEHGSNHEIDTSPLNNYLASKVILKYSIGQMCWIYIACLISAIVSLKFLSTNK